MKSKNKKIKAFTVVEMITSIAIIAILLGVLLPALSKVRTFANEAKQTAQIASIEIAVNMYKNDIGDYPPSHGDTGSGAVDYTYCGAQTLAEALLGQDLLGFNPESIFKEGDTDDVMGYPTNLTTTSGKVNLESRQGPYLDRSDIGVFKTIDVFTSANFQSNGLVEDRYVICDSFTNFKRDIDIGGVIYKMKVGTPVLYFRANSDSQDIDSSTAVDKRIYNILDNALLIMQGKIDNTTKLHEKLMTRPSDFDTYRELIKDPFISSPDRPVKPDSFILISAGADGFYGTTDDICNFTPNFQ